MSGDKALEYRDKTILRHLYGHVKFHHTVLSAATGNMHRERTDIILHSRTIFQNIDSLCWG